MPVLLLKTVLAIAFLAQILNAQEEAPETKNLREYLKIRTDHPNPKQGYDEATEWFRNQASQLNLTFNWLDLPDSNDEFALWLTWPGSEPHLKSVMFNSHMDVVPAEPSKWIYPPFDAFKDVQGNIYARGAVDMKSTTVAILEAIRQLKQENFQPLRNIHLVVMPEEEKGGFRGTRGFIQTEEFQKLNIGVDIDEGGVNAVNDQVTVAYTEKAVWQFNITAKGLAGHGSTLPEFTAGQRLNLVIQRLFEFRQAQYNKLENNPELGVDQLTVVNLVQIGGGVAENVIPSAAWAVFDMRVKIEPGWNFTDVEAFIHGILNEARSLSSGYDNAEMEISWIAQTMETGETVTNGTSGWWTVVEKTCDNLNVTCKPVVASAASDGRYIRNLNIPVFGMNLFLNTPNTMHQDNERINENGFLNGIGRYAELIKNLATLPDSIEA